MNFPQKRRFRAWLEKKAPDAVVVRHIWGTSCCPLALFLNDNGASEAYVRPDREGASRSCWRPDWSSANNKWLPVWANRFALKLDEQYGSEKLPVVTAAMCLEILSQC